MIMKQCIDCGKDIQDAAKICRFCRAEQPQNNAGLLNSIRSQSKLHCTGGIGKSMGVFAAANFAVLLLLLFVVNAIVPEYSTSVFWCVLLFGCSVPFIMLLFSKAIAKWQFDIREIKTDSPANEREKFMLDLIVALSERANLPAVPEIGIYQSEEINAFATGCGKSHALIAFSSGLLEQMSEEDIAAVAAHETAHIAKGDMLTMTLLEGLINSIVIAVEFAIEQTDWYEKMREKSKFISIIVQFAIVNVLMFAGDLVLLWFSRHREFEADETAARLVSPQAMIGALQALGEDGNAGSKTEAGAPSAAMMISAPPAWADLFSTHPALERRIEYIKRKFNC